MFVVICQPTENVKCHFNRVRVFKIMFRKIDPIIIYQLHNFSGPTLDNQRSNYRSYCAMISHITQDHRLGDHKSKVKCQF